MLAEPQSADKHRPAKPFGDAFGVTERAKYYRQYTVNADYADICAEHQLSVLKPFVQQPGAKSIGTREYRAARRGQGWKYQAMAMIEDAMTVAGTREEFCSVMASVGYDVNWSDERKYITYTCPNGMKVRDVKLHEEKYLKERMEYEFRIRSNSDNGGSPLGGTQSESESGKSDIYKHTVSADSVRDSAEAVGGLHRVPSGVDDLSTGAVQANRNAGNEGTDNEADTEDMGRGSELVRPVQSGCYGECEQHRSEGAGITLGQPGFVTTGWERERQVYLGSRLAGTNAAYGIREPSDENQAVDSYGSHRNDGMLGVVKPSDYSASEVKPLFEAWHGSNRYDGNLHDTDEPDDTGIRQLREQADNGNVYAMYRLAMKYLDEDSGVYNETLGDRYLQKAADKGHSLSEYRIGKMYLFGIYREDGTENAEYWLNRSSEHGNAYAQTLFGKALIDGDVLRVNLHRGIELLYESERNGNDYASYTLGKLYADGKKVKKDIPNAIAHLEKSAQSGNIFAQFRLAEIYLFEADVFDVQKAIEYLNLSARSGSEYANDALHRMSQNTMLSITTNIMELVADLDRMGDSRPVEDCTTMKQPARQKKKHDYEQSL